MRRDKYKFAKGADVSKPTFSCIVGKEGSDDTVAEAAARKIIRKILREQSKPRRRYWSTEGGSGGGDGGYGGDGYYDDYDDYYDYDYDGDDFDDGDGEGGE